MAAGLTPVATRPAAFAPAVHPVSTPRRYRRDIDGLRGISVLAVVLYHASARLLPGGFLGVDVFFVISGFLITELVRAGIDDGSFRFSEFLDRRIRRIVPALAIVLAVAFLLGVLTMFPAELAALGRSTWAGATFILNLMRFHDGPRADYFAPAAASNPLLHLWSLGVEEQFYLFWPAALLLLSRAGSRWVRTGTLAIAGLAFATFLTLTYDHELAAFYLPSSRMWELLAGALLTFGGSGAGVMAARAPSQRAFVGLVGLIVLAIVFVAAPAGPLGRVEGTTAAVAASLAVIAAGGDAWPNLNILSRPALVWLGLVSYPWYLWHWPLLTFLRLRDGRPAALGLFAAVAISLVLAAATYTYVERPLRRRSARSLRVPLLCALLVIAGVGAGAQAGWIVAPVETERARLVAASTDWDTPGRGLVTQLPSGLKLFSFGSDRPKRTVVFIGDSHVEHYWPRVEVLQRRLIDSATRVVFITRAGCPPLLAVERLDEPQLRCLDFTREAYAYARRPEVTTVAIAARWEGYFQPLNGATGHDAGPMFPLFRGNDTTLDVVRLRTPAAGQLERALAEQLAALRAQGKDVVVIGPNPADDRFDPRMMLNPLTRRPRVAEAVDADAYARYLAPVTAFLREATGGGTRAYLIDPMVELCPGGRCAAVDSSGTPLYRDADHLRARTARRLTVVDSVLWHGPASVAAPGAVR